MAPSMISDLARETLRQRIEDSNTKPKAVVPPPKCKNKNQPAATVHCALYCPHHNYIHPKIAQTFAKAVAHLLANTWAPPSLNNGDHDATFVAFAAELMGRTQVQGAMVAISMLFLDQLWQKSKGVKLGRGSEYRLFTTALMLANKVMDDHRFPNVCWADISGVALRELNVMERELLQSLEYNLLVPTPMYNAYAEKLHRAIVAVSVPSRLPAPPAMVRSPALLPPKTRTFSSPVLASRRSSLAAMEMSSPNAYVAKGGASAVSNADAMWMSPRSSSGTPSRTQMAAAVQQSKLRTMV
ncbi:hypothetical protein BJ742DRAFT_777548 [Cladochytrium replicatum]|nr:hypothetical protein BJ742DRAFT_777548 [Cladochytrium replicatum]